MKKINFILIFTVFSYLLSCNNEENDRGKIYNLKGEKIEIQNPEEIGYPTYLLPINNSLLFVLDYYHTNHLSLVDIQNKKHLKHLCRKGAGPREVKHPTSI